MLALPYSAIRLILQRPHGLGVALALLLTSACGTSPSEQSATADLPVEPSDTPLPSPVPTTDPSDYTQCGWKWNTRPLPDLTDEVQAGLDAAGIQGATAIVYAFGEDCFDPQTGTVLRFATLETDIDITLEVANLGDLEALGNLAEQVLVVLDGFPPNSVPGAQPGQISLGFTSGEEQRWLRFPVEQANNARERGLRGSSLLEALGYSP
jgi:hypothetical protein